MTEPVPEAGAPGTDAGGDSSTVTPEAGADGAVRVDGGGDAGDGAAPDTRIDPIEVGRAWTYNVTVIGIYPLCTNGIHTATTLGSAPLDGKTALEVQSLCENAGTFKYAVEGDRVFVHLGGSWKLSLDSPVAAGHTWTDGTLNYRWDKIGAITTAAGKFDDCWQATTVAAYTSYIQLCRGVGPVKWHYETGFGNGYEAVLTAKNF
ncbi:MAG: hypothetical protein JST00_00075 [Deltaproteobacteria bacterium]|nr:hypothetical protein [Deltaproteobacteria bacterium]